MLFAIQRTVICGLNRPIGVDRSSQLVQNSMEYGMSTLPEVNLGRFEKVVYSNAGNLQANRVVQ